MQSKLLLAATAVTGAVAINLSGTFPQAFRRAIEDGSDDQTNCLVIAAQNSAVLEDFPVLPTAEGSALLNIPTLSDPCSFPTVTGSVGSVVTSYSSALESWKDAHVTELRSIWQACSDVPEFSSVIAEYGDALCSTVLVEITSADATATATATGTVSVTETGTVTATDATVTASGEASGTASGEASATGEASASGEAASTTAQPAAAPKETGLFVAAAAAAAGVLGAVML